MSPKAKVRSHKLPFVFVNMAMTADGKIATANRAGSSFGSARDREHLLQLRATADAVMAGAAHGEFGSHQPGFRSGQVPAIAA